RVSRCEPRAAATVSLAMAHHRLQGKLYSNKPLAGRGAPFETLRPKVWNHRGGRGKGKRKKIGLSRYFVIVLAKA
ncbi:MAG: hypothetical protein LBO68_06100, partial [Synergistaceae bacterium]|nr:hypothetical protein [Synergistaceae bacterium]